jgi:hypothetical protein
VWPKRPKPVITSSKIRRMPRAAVITQALQIAFRRREDAGGAEHRLDKNRGHRVRIARGQETKEVVGPVGALVRLAPNEDGIREPLGPQPVHVD